MQSFLKILTQGKNRQSIEVVVWSLFYMLMELRKERKNVQTLQSYRKEKKNGKMKITGEGCRETKENGHGGVDERK